VIAKIGALVSAGILLVSPGFGYYYYTYFNSTAPPYTPIVARFDLNTLNNNTVPFFISGTGPSALYPGDSLAAMTTQIAAAANVWNGVSTSSIKLSYGGFYPAGTTQTAPGIQVQFSDDIPPGLLAYSALSVVGGVEKGPNGSFLPIFLSLMELPSDMPKSTIGPSYSEQFFLTVVHEFGHTLGLQHTLASSVMSTMITTASTKANPLGDDDVAAISLLYPSGNYLSTVGSITGTVTMNGAGVNLASVVAISPSNQAIATLTNPDGTYQINGIKPGIEYYVYVHSLPPALEGESGPNNIWLPMNSAGKYLPATTGFATLFYPGTQDPNDQAGMVSVTGGQVLPQQINFNVTPASGSMVASVRSFSYFPTPGVYVSGAPVLAGGTTTIAAYGSGLVQTVNNSTGATALTPGLSIGMLGTAAQMTNLRVYPPPNQQFIAVDATPGLTARPGPLHLLFRTPGNLYVLPSGFNVVEALPPLISASGPAQGGGVAISGAGFTPQTRILFDGVPGTIQAQLPNILIVTPPPATPGYTAALTALNADGQSSLFLSQTAATYTYGGGPVGAAAVAPSVVVSPASIPSGGATTIDVQGTGTHFTQGLTTVGFGTSDVQVGQINVLSPTHLTVAVTPNVILNPANITITTGLEAISQAVGSQITTK